MRNTEGLIPSLLTRYQTFVITSLAYVIGGNDNMLGNSIIDVYPDLTLSESIFMYLDLYNYMFTLK